MALWNHQSVKLSFITHVRILHYAGRVKRDTLSRNVYCVVTLGLNSAFALFADISPTFVRVLTALSQARRGLTHPVTVMFYTPAGPFSY